MIVVDTSALFAVVARERERETFINILDQTDGAQCSAVSYVEAVMALTGRSKTTAAQKVSALFEEFRIEIVAVDPILAEASVAAFDLYGKGRHRARLNLGDCFSYALAKTRDLPLLFKGDDFVHTDIVPAWRP
ncbi:type II toxin-antitoxin system VapC family toxin [Pseudorhodoplanes sp.]|uniref:type II toxin-antitoxin system VapC family toxin n=1 Tax=Pseudorhodoplanes sp. TaxID=1934341 RepID=UPI002CD5FA50|nr:type II toxin-antitoxin system VapC family toxin [Pseudorhodoplanes sp.]HWV42130.1 type II toxin-antitoxin system VapC family toxin [Pseudorhodoplanes sp.]